MMNHLSLAAHYLDYFASIERELAFILVHRGVWLETSLMKTNTTVLSP